MDPMKKSSRKEVLLRKYMQIINEIEDIHFEDESVQAGMLVGCVCVFLASGYDWVTVSA